MWWTPSVREGFSYALGVALLLVYLFRPELRDPALMALIFALLGLPQAIRADLRAMRNGGPDGAAGRVPPHDGGAADQPPVDPPAPGGVT